VGETKGKGTAKKGHKHQIHPEYHPKGIDPTATSSGFPPTSDAITGRPVAMASRMVLEMPLLKVPDKPRGVAPLFVQTDDLCRFFQQFFRIFGTAESDDNMRDIIRPMVDQGGNPFFQPPDPEGINYMSDFYHSAYSNPVSGFGLITDPWTDNYLLFFEFFESHSFVDRLCSHINAWKENLEKSRKKVCTCTNKPVI